MKKFQNLILAVLAFFLCFGMPSIAAQTGCSALLNQRMQDINGREVNLCDYQGNVLLLVNVASKCGLTEQYDDLEALYQKYKNQGFIVLAFPANDFKNQEPGTEAQIQSFARERYGVTFPMFSKIHVKGPQIHPLYQKLTAQSGPVEWNFQKYLISRDGNLVQSFSPKTKPADENLQRAIQAELDKVSVSFHDFN